MESSTTGNIFNWLFGPKQTAEWDPLQSVPQSSSDSSKESPPRGLVVSLELEQRGSGASGPANAERSSASEEEKANSNAEGEDQLTEIVGRNESDNEYGREQEDRADCIIHSAPINIKTAEVNVQEKEGLKDKLGQTEFQTAKVKVEEKEESEENPLQDQCKAVKVNLKEEGGSKEEPETSEVKAVKKKVKKKVKSNVEPTPTKLQTEKVMVEEKEESKENLIHNQCWAKEIDEKEEYAEKPRQNEEKPTEARLKIKEDSEVDPRQTECTAKELIAPEKEESLNIGKAQCKRNDRTPAVVKAVKVNLKEEGVSIEEPGKSDVKAAKKKKKPTQTKLQGSSEGVEAKRGSNGEVENGRTEVEEEKESREGEEGKTVVQNENKIGNETEKGNTEKKEDARVGPEKHIKYPVQPEAEDCAHYMKTWICKFGSNCKFNHPAQKKFQAAEQKMKEVEESKEKPGQIKSKVKEEEAPKEKSGQTKSKATKEKLKEKMDYIGNRRQFECKFYSNPEGCKFGKGCKFSHKKTNFVPPAVRLNFMGLPMRPGVKDCTYFMQTATCILDAHCKFNHPDPTTAIDDEPSVQDSHGECTSSQSTQQSPCSDESTPFVSMEHSAYNTEWSPNESTTDQEQWVMKDGEDSDHLGQPQHGFRSNDKDRQMS